MKKTSFFSQFALAASASLALAFTLSCSDDKDDDKSSGGGSGGERYLTITGLDEYNGYFVAASLFKGTLGVSEDGCIGAEKDEKEIANGKIKLLLVSNKDPESLKPCPNGEYSIWLMLSPEPEDVSMNAYYANANYFYTGGKDVCVSVMSVTTGTLPTYKLQKDDITMSLSGDFGEDETVCFDFF